MNSNSLQWNDSKFAIGLMTGTVLDGHIDVALLKSNGEHIDQFGPYSLEAYDEGIVEILKQTLDTALEWQFTGPEPKSLQLRQN